MTTTPDEVYRLAQSADLTLTFDASVTVRRGFLPLCEQANRINERRHRLGIVQRIRLCVPAVAHTERLFGLAQEHGEKYDVEFVRRVLGERQVQVADFTIQEAEHCAGLLAQRYETPAQWRAFKKRRCLECVGLPAQYHCLAEGSGGTCGAPNDWLIIAQASRGNMLLVMEDKGCGGEYALVERIARYDDVRATLERILNELDREFAVVEKECA